MFGKNHSSVDTGTGKSGNSLDFNTKSWKIKEESFSNQNYFMIHLIFKLSILSSSKSLFNKWYSQLT